MCIITTQITMTDKLSIQITMENRQHMTKYWSDSLSPQQSRQAIITVSRSLWMTKKINGVTTDLLCTGVIGHPGCMFLN